MRRPISRKGIIILAGILAILLAGGLLAFQMFAKRNESGHQIVSVRKEVFVLFYPDANGMLKKKSVEAGNDVIPDKTRAEMIMAELKKENAVRDTVAIRDVVIDSDGIMYLNLSNDIRNDEMGSIEEITTVYSIVNSILSNFKSAKKVQLLIEGEAFHTLNGVLYIYDPIEFNNNLVEE